jgi:hypothetical protein
MPVVPSDRALIVVKCGSSRVKHGIAIVGFGSLAVPGIVLKANTSVVMKVHHSLLPMNLFVHSASHEEAACRDPCSFA